MGKQDIFCQICNKKIKVKIQAYSRITDFNHGRLIEEKFYHSLCWNERFTAIKQNQEGQRIALNFLKKADAFLTEQTGIKEVVDIR